MNTLVYLNLVIAGAAAGVYAVMSYKWVTRGSVVIAVLYLLASMACVGFAIGYIWVAVAAPDATMIQRTFRALTTLTLFAPALTKFLELRREERREAFAVEFYAELKGKSIDWAD